MADGEVAAAPGRARRHSFTQWRVCLRQVLLVNSCGPTSLWWCGCPRAGWREEL